MGYTHYWGFSKPPHGGADAAERKYAAAIDACATMVREWAQRHGELQGYSAHTEPGLYSGINFNGSRDTGYEDFCLPAEMPSDTDNGFCKTGGRPYDTLVVACLVMLKARLGSLITVSSDGEPDDWAAGLQLCRVYLPTAQLPDTIRKRESASRRPTLQLVR